MNARLLLMSLALTLLAGCGSFGSSRELSELPDYVPGAKLELAWRGTVAGSELYALTPAIVGDNALLVAGAKGIVARLEKGREVWRTDLAMPLSAGVGSDGKLAVVVTRSGEAVALNVADGSEKWRASVGAEVLAPPSVTATAVAIRASDSRIFGLSPETGTRKWVYRRTTPALVLRSHAGMLAQEKVAVAGFPGGKMVAINLDNGGALWELTVALPKGTTELERVADVVGTPVLEGRHLCAVAFQGRTVCFDAATGNLLWSRDISSASGLGRDLTQVYVVDDSGAVQALDAATGASVWKQDKLAGRELGRPLAIGKHVAVVDAEGQVSLLHREDGSLVARLPTDGSAPAVDALRVGEDRFAVQTRDGGIFVLTAR